MRINLVSERARIISEDFRLVDDYMKRIRQDDTLYEVAYAQLRSAPFVEPDPTRPSGICK